MIIYSNPVCSHTPYTWHYIQEVSISKSTFFFVCRSELMPEDCIEIDDNWSIPDPYLIRISNSVIRRWPYNLKDFR
jgi:hypothetical protein